MAGDTSGDVAGLCSKIEHRGRGPSGDVDLCVCGCLLFDNYERLWYGDSYNDKANRHTWWRAGDMNLNNELQREYPNYFDGQDPLRAIDRREKPEERKTFEVSKIWEQHEEIIRRLLVGQKASQIAEDMSVSRAMVSYVRKSRVVQDRLAELKAERDSEAIDMAKYIKKKAPEALRLLEKIIDGDIDAPTTVRAREANNWLDRAGYAPVRNIQAQHIHGHFTSDEIEDLKRQAIANGFAQPSPSTQHLIDVTPATKDEVPKVANPATCDLVARGEETNGA